MRKPKNTSEVLPQETVKGDSTGGGRKKNSGNSNLNKGKEKEGKSADDFSAKGENYAT